MRYRVDRLKTNIIIKCNSAVQKCISAVHLVVSLPGGRGCWPIWRFWHGWTCTFSQKAAGGKGYVQDDAGHAGCCVPVSDSGWCRWC